MSAPSNARPGSHFAEAPPSRASAVTLADLRGLTRGDVERARQAFGGPVVIEPAREGKPFIRAAKPGETPFEFPD
jgi:hypothetical protein